MTDDPELKAELVYGLDISELDPYSPQFRQTTDLICLCQLYDRYHHHLLPVEHNALLHAIEQQCELSGVSFASLQLDPKDDDEWRERLLHQRQRNPPRSKPKIKTLDEAAARRLAEQNLLGSGLVLRSGKVLRNGNVWRFPVRMEDVEDTPFDGEEMIVMVCVGTNETAN